VCLRGHCIAQGYYKLAEQTAEAFSEDGWFYTGDVGKSSFHYTFSKGFSIDQLRLGEFREDGTLAIIDRKKNLVKLAHGEYIALEKMENKYKDSVLVENVCVFGDSSRYFLPFLPPFSPLSVD